MAKTVKAELVLFDDPQLVRLEERIGEHRTNTINEILETGKLLAMANEVLAEKGKNGKFGAWADERCGIARTTAFRYMKAFELFGGHQGIHGHVSWGAIEYLAGDVPDEAPATVIKEAKKGKVIWLPQAKAIVKAIKESIFPSVDETTTSENVPDLEQIDEDDDSEVSEWVEEAASEEPEEDPTAEELLADHNKLIESYCRAVMKLAKDTRPDVQWLDHKGRWDGAMRKIKQGLDTIRSAKAVLCPKCDGDGCQECQQHGYLPKIDAESIA